MRYALLVVVLLAGCQAPAPAPVVVRATELAKSYRDDPAASKAYDGQRIHLALTNPVQRGRELHWHLASPTWPAVIVCRFDGDPPPVARVVWLTGTVRGRVHDGHTRDFPRYDFYVLVTDCRPSPPPDR